MKTSEPKYYIMVPASRDLGVKFKKWCKGQGISMTKAIPLLMREVVNGSFTLTQRIEKTGRFTDAHSKVHN